MGRRGPPPTPTALRVLHGETKPSRINRNEPQPTLGTPKPPRWLRKEARPFWRDLVRELEPMRVLTLVDRDMLALLADAECDYVRAQRLIDQHGGELLPGANAVRIVDGEEVRVVTGWVRNPAVMVKNHAFGRIKALAVQFGLSPASRVSLVSQPDNDPGLESLLS